MMMGSSEIILLLLLNLGGGANDAASWIPPDNYFKSRQIEATGAKLLELAVKDPSDGKTSLQQLLAIRWLGEHAAETKKTKGALDTLKQIADGKKAQDPQGFAKLYAQTALARLDGKTPPAPAKIPENSLRTDGAKWFPSTVALYGGGDLRANSTGNFVPSDAFRAVLLNSLRDREAAGLYEFIEEIGNFRIDRVSMAFAPKVQGASSGTIYIRLSGKADLSRLSSFILKNIKGSAIKGGGKASNGEPITIVEPGEHEPGWALVGDSDVIIAGRDGRDTQGKEVIKEVLEVIAGKKANATTGPLAGLLKKSSPVASSLMVGDLPDEMRRGITTSPLEGCPKTVILERVVGQTLQLRALGTFDKDEEAKAFAENATKLKQQGLDLLKKVPEEVKIPKEKLALFSKALEGVKIAADGKNVTGSGEVTEEVFKAAQDVIAAQVKRWQEDTMPKPPPKPEPKFEKKE